MIKNSKSKYLITYTLLFIVIGSFFYFFYVSQGKALFNLNGDGYRQCYRAIIYYQKYLKEIINNIFINHSFVIPQWDFTLGEGSDIIQTLNYYVIGDPFALFCIFVPYDYLYLYIDLAAFTRLYCAGLAFGYLCFYLNNNNWIAITTGSLSYIFCLYGIMYTIEFPFMLNYMVFLPLIIIGIEKIIKENRYLLLIISVFLSASSCFTFFYLTVVLTIVYCLIRFIYIKLSIKEKIVLAIKIIISSLLGVCLAASALLPTIINLINNSRVTKDYGVSSIISLAYVKTLHIFMFGDHIYDADIGGITIPCLLSTITLLFSRKKSKKIELILLIFLLLAMNSPFFCQLINGMTYTSTRWSASISLLISYIFVDNYDYLIDLSDNKVIYFIIAIIVFACAMYFDSDRLKIHILLLVATIFTLIILMLKKNNKIKNILLLSFSICYILLDIFNILSPTLWNYVHKATDISMLNKESDKEILAADSINDSSFYRYSGNELICNESSSGYNPSTNYYWSFPNDNIVNFRTDLGFYDYNLNHYDGYDNRSQLLNLASVKYYLAKDTNAIPYNHEFIDSNNGYDIYRNDDYLPLFYAYSNSINYDEWKKLDLLERQETLLYEVVLEDGSNKENIEYTEKEIKYNLEDSNDIAIGNNNILVNNIESSIKMHIDYDEPGEYYIVIHGFDYNDGTSTQVYFNSSNGMSNTLFHKTKDHLRYAGRNDYAVCLGYIDKPLEYIDISFLLSGEYVFNDIGVYKLDVAEYKNPLENLKDINIKELNVLTNRIHSEIVLDEDKFICASIPYTKGWKAYIDGKEVELKKANVMYMGFDLDKGQHTIDLQYNTPGFKLGLCLSLTSLILIVVCEILKNKKDKV